MAFQIIALLGFGLIAFQDVRERMVYWVLFPLVGLFLGLAHWQRSTPEVFMMFSLANAFFVTMLLFISWLYTKYIKGSTYLNHSFGLGDLLFFYAIAFGFPTMTFMVLFVFALVFSLALHIALGIAKKQNSVPLAGYMSLFFMAMVLLSYVDEPYELYLY